MPEGRIASCHRSLADISPGVGEESERRETTPKRTSRREIQRRARARLGLGEGGGEVGVAHEVEVDAAGGAY
jgi:hypothetical protein